LQAGGFGVVVGDALPGFRGRDRLNQPLSEREAGFFKLWGYIFAGHADSYPVPQSFWGYAGVTPGLRSGLKTVNFGVTP